MTAALDRAVANALGLKSVHNCEKWGEHMTIPPAAGDEGFYGLPQESVSSSNAGGKCVTVGETTPFRLTEENIDPNQWAFDQGLEST